MFAYKRILRTLPGAEGGQGALLEASPCPLASPAQLHPCFCSATTQPSPGCEPGEEALPAHRSPSPAFGFGSPL